MRGGCAWMLCWLLLGAGALVRAGDEPACVAWPGEMDPLPRTSSRDPIAARWARLRAAELSLLAEALEWESPSEAFRLWTHVACLDPASVAGARARALRPRFVVAERPLPSREAAPARALSPPAARADARPAPPRRRDPVRARARDQAMKTAPSATAQVRADVAAAPPAAPAPDLAAMDAGIASVEDTLVRARFRDALEQASSLRAQLASLAPEPAVLERLARVEVATATAFAALRLPEDAARSFARALEADPDLELDPERTPPKIQRLLEEVRARRGRP